jgi:hypothetical protein
LVEPYRVKEIRGNKMHTVYVRLTISEEIEGLEGFMEGLLHPIRELQIDGVISGIEWGTNPFKEYN